jgi:hypothetical protein
MGDPPSVDLRRPVASKAVFALQVLGCAMLAIALTAAAFLIAHYL